MKKSRVKRVALGDTRSKSGIKYPQSGGSADFSRERLLSPVHSSGRGRIMVVPLAPTTQEEKSHQG